MSRAHLIVGWLTLGVFAATGVYMRLHPAEVAEHGEAARYSLRANHIYILMSGLINLALAISRPATPPFRLHLARFGRILALAAPAVLFAAFAIEGPHPRPERPITAVGVLMLAIGVVSVLIGSRTKKLKG